MFLRMPEQEQARPLYLQPTFTEEEVLWRENE